MIEKVTVSIRLRHIAITNSHNNLILLKQGFSHVAFLQNRVETKPGEWECLHVVSIDIF